MALGFRPLAGAPLAGSTAPGVTLAYAYPVADIAAGGWLGFDPLFGGSPPLYAMIDETVWDSADYIYSPNNPTTEQFEVKLGTIGNPGVTTSHGVDIGLRALNLDTNFDLNLVQGTTVLDSWTEFVTDAEGHVVRTHAFSGAVAATITDYSDLRIRGVARA